MVWLFTRALCETARALTMISAVYPAFHLESSAARSKAIGANKVTSPRHVLAGSCRVVGARWSSSVKA